jgi:hypothetical protein
METASPTSFEFQPELIAVGIIVIGVVAARLASIGAGYALNQLDALAARVTTSGRSVLTPRLIRLVKGIVFWLVLTLSIAIGLQTLGSGGLPAMVDLGIGFIPQLLAGTLIVVFGHLLGLVAGTLLSGINNGALAETAVPRLVHGMIVIVAIVIGLQQVNVDISFVTRLILIVVAVTGAGLALAFGLGSRGHVANLMASREIETLTVGERIRVDGIEGEVIEIRATGVSLSTDSGIARVPAARFAEAVVLHLEGPQSDG